MRPLEDELRVFGARGRSYCHLYCATNVRSGNGQKENKRTFRMLRPLGNGLLRKQYHAYFTYDLIIV